MPTQFSSLEAFRLAIEILAPEDAAHARQCFVAARLDPAYAQESGHVLRPQMSRDGLTYTGYLWDFLIDKHQVTEAQIWGAANLLAPSIYFMWDLHSADRVSNPDYYRFPLGTVARTTPAYLRAGLKYLPEDLYLLDQTMAWGGALTHEYVGDGQRYCVWSGDLPYS